MEKILINSLSKSFNHKHTYLCHAQMVRDTAVDIAKENMLSGEYYDFDILQCVDYAAYLHDLGKLSESMQKFLKKNGTDEDKSKTIKYRHNEVSWAILALYTNVSEYVLHTVYWHHSIWNKMNTITAMEIHDSLTDGDIKLMRYAIEQYLPAELIREEINERVILTPTYYTENEVKNMFNTFIRTCVISADQAVSRHIETGKGKYKHDTTYYYKKPISKIKIPESYDKVRYKKQLDIISKIGKTTIVKAPAGFGKTTLGLLWSLKRREKLIWVCPRNTVAHSVYHSLLEELATFNILSLSVELYLTGEVVKSNKDNFNGFESDIIVTNIDNYLAPSVDNRNADRLHMIVNSDVVFDEYHEFVSDAPLFSCFINLMNLRNNGIKSQTVLLSATPIQIERLWNSTFSQTIILPNEHEHYQAVHNKPYRIRISDTLDIKTKKNNLIIYNSIKNAQECKKSLEEPMLVHSDFEPKRKLELIDTLYSKYDKHSRRILAKGNVIGTPIIQASLDISFLNLYESVLSPEATMQRIGRVDRWGDYKKQPTINIYKELNGDVNIRNILYSSALTELWYRYVIENFKSEMTLDELYCLYNKFNNTSDYKEKINRYIRNKYTESLIKLRTIYPKKLPNKTNKEVITAGSNKLRTCGIYEIFFIVKKENGEFTDPFTRRIYKSISEEFSEFSRTQILISKAIKQLMNDDRFGYKNLYKPEKKSIGELQKMAIKSDTPYIAIHWRYDEELGILRD